MKIRSAFFSVFPVKPTTGRSFPLAFGLMVMQVLMGLMGPAAYGSWIEEWDKTVAAAKKEGQVNIYMSGYGALLDSGEFQKAYPGIKIVAVTGRGHQITQRVLAERRAGKYLADIISTGVPFPYPQLYRAKVLDPIRPAIILPEVKDESKWWHGKHRYADPKKQYVFIYVGVPQTGSVHYNTKLVNPKEIKSFWDFLDPKWKGKMEARDVRTPGPGSGAIRFYYHSPKLGPKFISRLFSEGEVTLFRSFRLGTDWLANGKYAVCFFCSGISRAKRQGLPVDSFGVLNEGAGLVSHFGGLTLANRGRHPNAAKVFINWFLSRKGQLALQRVLAQTEDNVPDSLRTDIPKDMVPMNYRRVKGIDYLELDSRPDWIEMGSILKVFGEAIRQKR